MIKIKYAGCELLIIQTKLVILAGYNFMIRSIPGFSFGELVGV